MRPEDNAAANQSERAQQIGRDLLGQIGEIRGPYSNEAILEYLRARLEWTERNRARSQALVDVLLREECDHQLGTWPNKKVAKAIKRYRNWACGA